MAEINVGGASSLYMKVDITNVRQNVAGNSSTVKFVASMRQTSGNNWNQVPGVNFKVVVNGSTKADTTGFFLDVRGNVTQVFYTADVVIPHNTDGTKSFTWSFWFDPKGTYSTYKPTTLSGTQALPRIARVSNSTLSANAFDFGESFTVYTNQTDPSFTHTISYIRGTTVTSLATAVKTSTAVTIPTAQISNYTTATTASMKIRTSTYSGSTLVGDYDLDVTVRVPSWAVPTIGAVSFTGSSAIFTASDQFVASRDRLKATVANVNTSYSSAIKKYLYRVSQRHTFSMEGTENGATFSTFNFPATGSEVVNIQMAVVDARGRQSAWSTSPAIRVHAYQAPSIGAMVITRNANVTTVNVRRNWSVTPLYESGSTSAPKNKALLTIKYRNVGGSTWSDAGGRAETLNGVNSNVALTPSFSGGTSYEFQIELSDWFQKTTAPIIRIGTEFVPLDIGPQGVGVGKVHSNGAFDLEVGSGGIRSEGGIWFQGKSVQVHPLTHPTSGSAITVTGNWNDVIQTGFYQGSSMTNQSPGAHSWKYVRVTQHNSLYTLQESIDFSGTGSYYRVKDNGTWSGWKNLDPTQHFISQPNSTTNLNSMIKSGAYRTAGDNANMFPNGTWSQMLTIRGGDDTIAQLGIPYKGENPSVRAGSPSEVGGAGSWGAWKQLAYLSNIPRVFNSYHYTATLGIMELSNGRIWHGNSTGAGAGASTFNSLGNTVTFPTAFNANTANPITITHSITSNVVDVQNRMITVNIRNVSRTGFTWDARDSASGTAPSGGTKYTLYWIAIGTI